ncbi:MAG: NADH-quinone oxidoreductase subunit NuoK [Coriobacteriia bacterium]|nr:NADH-quinone oxidoreductase subunit NuoK [Coriobacteriia bacterium]
MNVLVVCAALFCLGLYGVLVRRDVIGVLASVEVMLGAASVQLIASAMTAASSVAGPDPATAEALGLLVLVLAAAEAAVGLALLVSVVKRTGRGRVDELVEVEG